MKVLVACEVSQVVTKAFRARGHEAYSCDLVPTTGDHPEWHAVKDALLMAYDYDWDLMIAHPECTYLCSSGIHWNTRIPGRKEKTAEAVEFVNVLWNAPIDKICIENPQGVLSTLFLPPSHYIQPYEFGHDASKKTGLWLKNLPPLVKDPTKYVQPRIVNGKKRWANQTDSGQNRLGPSDHRAADRARTYEGIAEAMASQWGGDI